MLKEYISTNILNPYFTFAYDNEKKVFNLIKTNEFLNNCGNKDYFLALIDPFNG